MDRRLKKRTTCSANTNSQADSAPARPCPLRIMCVFIGDGSFQNIQGAQTWTETWQGVAEGCNSPAAPHDGSNAAPCSLANGDITLTGLGAYLGITKVINGCELANPADAPGSIT
jgi:hypothetical protein